MVLRNKSGLFVTLEGGEGAGKSTQAHRLAQALRARGHEVLLTREPGGTPGAEEIRNLLLFGEAELSWRAEIMAHMAARCDHLDQRIRPALAAGHIVVCDRFHDSTMAYQGYGAGRGTPERLALISGLRALVGCEPDLTLLLDLPRKQALARLTARGGRMDRYEGQAEAFHERVLEGFDAIATQDPRRIVRIDATRTPETIEAALIAAVSGALAQRVG